MKPHTHSHAWAHTHAHTELQNETPYSEEFCRLHRWTAGRACLQPHNTATGEEDILETMESSGGTRWGQNTEAPRLSECAVAGGSAVAPRWTPGTQSFCRSRSVTSRLHSARLRCDCGLDVLVKTHQALAFL